MRLVNIHGTVVNVLVFKLIPVFGVVDFYFRKRKNFTVCPLVRFAVQCIRVGFIKKSAVGRGNQKFIGVEFFYAFSGKFVNTPADITHNSFIPVPAVKIPRNRNG